MLTATDLLQKYREILLTPIDANTCESGECISMLYCSEWVKILVVRSPEEDELCTIEVEVSFPTCIIEPNLISHDIDQKEAREFTETTITHLKYLLGLHDNGFILGIISTEGIWSAVLDMNGVELEKLFEILLPPSCS